MREIFNIALIGKSKKKASEALKAWMKKRGLPEEDIWSAVLVNNREQKAGYLPTTITSEHLVDAVKNEETSDLANSFFNQFLFIDKKELLAEMVTAMEQKQLKLDYKILPLVLQEAAKSPELKELIRPVIGQRGEWLVAQHPIWTKAFAIPIVEDWEAGNAQERLTYFQYLRKTRPTDALHLLIEDWKTETPKQQVLFLEALRIGLSKSDELFIEEQLSAKRKEIREKTTALLTALPNSAFVNRNLARFEAISTLKNSLLKTTKIQFDLPDQVPADALADAINPRSKTYTGQQKANYLGQIIANINVERWPPFFKSTPENILSIFSKTEWAQVLFEGLISAASRTASKEWAKALFEFWIDNEDKNRWQNFKKKRLFELTPLLSKNDFNELALKAIRRFNDIEETSLTFHLLSQANKPWTKALAIIFYKKFKTAILENRSSYWANWHYKNMLKQAAIFAPIDSIKDANFYFANYESIYNWKKDIDQFFELLEMRKKYTQ